MSGRLSKREQDARPSRVGQRVPEASQCGGVRHGCSRGSHVGNDTENAELMER